MANNHQEIEIQVNIEDSAPLLGFLAEKAIFKYEVRQIDRYFSPAGDSFLATRPVSRWLRLRQSEKGCSLNYKNWHFDQEGRSDYCDEFETKIGDIDTGTKILEALGFEGITVVDKRRQIWTYGDYEIAIDSIKGLGDFVEIEYIGSDDAIDPRQTTDGMIAFLKGIGVGKITRNYVGYPFILLFPDEVRYDTL